ncbi:MAG: glycosyltransferase [Candidatus Saganbacteria bacterium]|nr:glycosyltransferase [Candidatus Saganbacteria bacterium]
MIDISVIIVNYNNQRFLEGCLGSLFAATRRARLEVIFVDNHSGDGSVEFVRRHYPQVKIIENRANLGFCRANNRGLKIYRGRYALLLNTDTIVKDGALDKMLEFMDAHPEAGAAGPKLLNADGTPQRQGGLFNRRFWLAREPVKVDYVIGAALMVRRDAIERAGGLDDNFFFSNDDLDWCRRIRKAGWRVYFVPQAEIVHFGGFTINRFKQRIFVEGFRGGLYFSRKHYGPLIYQVYRCLLIFIMLLAIPVTALLYPWLTNKGKLGAFRQILMIALRGELIPKYGGGKTVLLVSNGHAEDLAGAAIGAGLRELLPDVELRALPLVGLGQAYDKQGIGNLGLRRTLPSGGFAKEGLGHFLRDLLAGLPGQFARQVSRLKAEAKNADLIVAAGDAYLVALCGLFGRRKPLIFVDGPKSVKIEGYYPLELWLMKKFCRQIVVQDRETADHLKGLGLPAQYLGSWVMDYVPATGEDFGLPREQTVIGLLPGSRAEAYDNLLLILELFDELRGEKLTGLVASTLDREKVRQKCAARGWEFAPLAEHGLTGKLTSRRGSKVLLAEGKFADVCLRAKLVIGLAGIANEQAAAFGRPVVCFPGRGPQTTLRRWHEIRKITGGSMLVLTGSTEKKAAELLALLNDRERLAEMGRLGRASKPEWGGTKNIVRLVADAL